ncbi:hypothetical protein EDB19DRAFT_1839698 [Suillus lakei]|nr:hypothetical protein EDB19DRAFT_1839698 [Suillus lakei]
MAVSHRCAGTVTHCPVGVDLERVVRVYFNAHKYQQSHPNPNVNKHKPAFAQASNLPLKPSSCLLLTLEKLLHDYLAWQRKFMLVQMASLVLTDAPKLERQVSELATY